jgi:ATP-dependent DNA helicase RecG
LICCSCCRRYEDRTRVSLIGALPSGSTAVIEGEVLLSELVFRRRRQLLVRISDGPGSITLRFFYSATHNAKAWRAARIRCYGEVARPAGLEMVHPEVTIAATGEALAQTLTPQYPSTEGLTQTAGACWCSAHSSCCSDRHYLTCCRRNCWRPSSAAAARGTEFMHQPPVAPVCDLASGRHPPSAGWHLKNCWHQISLLELRRSTNAELAPPLADASGMQRKLGAGLPFTLTAAQARVVQEIDTDLVLDHPMARLIQWRCRLRQTAGRAGRGARHRQRVPGGLMAPTELRSSSMHARCCAGSSPRCARVVLVTGSAGAR